MPIANPAVPPSGGLMSMMTGSQGMPSPGSGLINTAANYSFPLTSGLMGSLSNPTTPPSPAAAPGTTDWSQIALQMAGNPKAGPLAPVPVPSGTGIPGAGTSGGRSSIGSTVGGLLTAIAQNPSLAKTAANSVGKVAGLFSDPGIPGIAASSAPLASTSADILGGAATGGGDAFLGSNAIDASIQAGASMPAADAAFGAAAPAAADAAAPAAGGGLMSAIGDSSAAAGGADAGAAAGAGSLGLGLLGVGAVLAPALYGMSKPPVELNSTWYNNFGSNVGAGLAPGATTQQKLQAATALQELGLTSSGAGVDATRLMQTLAPYGITSMAQAQALANQLLNSIPAGAMPTGPGRGGQYVRPA